MMNREQPDIIIGYNIFGFDYNFMYIRSQENNCEEEFLTAKQAGVRMFTDSYLRFQQFEGHSKPQNL